MTVIAKSDDFEPLLTDDRVGKVRDMLRLAYPSLPYDLEVFSFIVPPGHITNPMGEEVPVPAQAVFAVQSPHPRRGFDQFYRDKALMSNTATWLSTWEAEEKMRGHFVSGSDDPAWGPFAVAAKNHLKAIKNLKELI